MKMTSSTNGVAGGDGLKEVSDGVVGITTSQALGIAGKNVLDSLISLWGGKRERESYDTKQLMVMDTNMHTQSMHMYISTPSFGTELT